MIDVCLLGTGGMMPLPYRYLTALYVRYNGKVILIDCGEGTQIAMKGKGLSPKPIDVICFTHFHADHISGLPGLLLDMGNADRTEPVTIIGPKGLERVVNALRVIAPELPFELVFQELEEQVVEIPIGDLMLTAFHVRHNVHCYGYSLSLSRGGRFQPQKAKEAGVPLPYWSRLQKGETIEADGVVYTPDMVLGPARKGLKLTYCTDTRPIDLIREQAMDADLFICEGMYGEKEKEVKAKKYRHMTMYEAAQLAKDAKVKQLWLTHYSPSLNHPENYAKAVREIFPDTVISKDGRFDTLAYAEDEDDES